MLTTVARDGRTVAWEEYGDPEGLPMVFLHGTPGGRLVMAARGPFFAELGLRVIATDRAGFGDTDALPGRTVLAQATDVVAVLDAVALHTAHIVGGSGGGPHALGVGVFAPERVQAVGVLFGAVPLRPEELAGQVAFNRGVFTALGDEAVLRRHLSEARRLVLEEGLEALLSDAPASDRAARAGAMKEINRVYAAGLAPGIEGMYDDFNALWHLPWQFEPEDVTVPVLWAHGTADVNVPYTAAMRVATRLPHAEIITWDGIGHAPTPDLLTDFLKELVKR